VGFKAHGVRGDLPDGQPRELVDATESIGDSLGRDLSLKYNVVAEILCTGTMSATMVLSMA